VIGDEGVQPRFKRAATFDNSPAVSFYSQATPQIAFPRFHVGSRRQPYRNSQPESCSSLTAFPEQMPTLPDYTDATLPRGDEGEQHLMVTSVEMTSRGLEELLA